MTVRELMAIVCTTAALGTAACGGSPTQPEPPPPPITNTPPVIDSITAASARVEVGEETEVSATVRDSETPIPQLSYLWTAPAGEFIGQGSTVRWRAPGGDATTPVDVPLTLTVVEQYGTPNAQGVRPEHRVSATSTPVRVHNSPRELSDLALAFLRDFADNRVPAREAVRHFTDSCPGKIEELEDVERIRNHFEVLASSFAVRTVNVNAARTAADIRASCAFESRFTSCSPELTGCVVGALDRPNGDCVFTARYEDARWWLCTSNFQPSSPLSPAMRALLAGR